MTSEHPSTEAIIDYIHHELSPTEDAAVFEHVTHCAACRATYEAELRLNDALQAAAASETLELPSIVKAQVWGEIRSSRSERWRSLLRPFIAIPVGAAIAAAAALFAVQSTPTNTHPPVVGAQYYFDVHTAATRQENPLSDRSVPLTIDAAMTGDDGDR